MPVCASHSLRKNITQGVMLQLFSCKRRSQRAVKEPPNTTHKACFFSGNLLSPNLFFLVSRDRTRGNGSKLCQGSKRVVKHCNRLPREVGDGPCQCLRDIWTMPLITCFNFWSAMKWSGVGLVGPFQLKLFYSILFYSILFYSILFYLTVKQGPDLQSWSL